ncbi:MAG: SulP family inorganic anion transporter [Calditrichaeota bacterium]|nr:MAG: SulP family inorganic anion transporter [Calditrichota bacterium]
MFKLHHKAPKNLKNDLLSGLTVAFALVPEAIAFALIAGIEPLVGLYAAFMVGLITAAIGGRPGMISGATGALAVVMVTLVAQHGIQYLFATVILMGLIQISVGVLRLGKFVRLIPHPVMLGFVNGLAIVIFLAQFSQLKVQGVDGNLEWMTGMPLFTMLGLIALTMAIIHFLPKFTKAVPASLMAIIVVTLIVLGLNLDTRVVGDMASVGGGFPEFNIPMIPFTWETLTIIFPYALILAAIGLIESLMTLMLIDELTNTRGQSNRECIGQGAANVVTGFFGGMGGCAMIGQSMINIDSGGRSRLSGISAALLLLIFILFASNLIEMIPLAALIGLMFMVALGTFEWSSFNFLRKIPKSDAFVLVLVSSVTVFADLAIAVITGVIVSALVFAWEKGKLIMAKTYTNEEGSKIYELDGSVFFGSVHNFLQLFTPEEDPDDVIIEFQNSRVVDQSGLEALNSLTEKYAKFGKKLHLRHLSEDCTKLLNKAESIVEISVIEDAYHHLVTDKFDDF